MSKNLDFTSTKRRIYLDLDSKVADMAKNKAQQARIPQKRYVELLIERDCAKRGK